MKYVLDSNISLKWVLTEADSDKASRIGSGIPYRVRPSFKLT